MDDNKVVMIDPISQKSMGRIQAVFQRVCNNYTCEDIPIEMGGVDAHGIGKNRVIVMGLAVTQRPRGDIYIPQETFEEFGKTLIGKPLADGHGDFPWAAIKVDEILGVVTEAWWSDEYESLMFKAEVFDEKAIEVMKKKMYINFSVAYWFEWSADKIINEYDEEEDVRKVTVMEFDHIAYLPDPQVPESEIKGMEEMAHSMGSAYMEEESLVKTYRHNSTIKEDEFDWGDVDRTRLPWNAFANWKVLDKKKKSTWKYPHHWVSSSKMYLHGGGLIYALAAAKGARSGKRASSAIFTHLRDHVKKIKLSAEEFKKFLKESGKFEDEVIEEILLDDEIQSIFGGKIVKDDKEIVDPKEEVEEEELQETPEETPEETPKADAEGDNEEEAPEEETPEEPAEETPEETPEEPLEETPPEGEGDSEEEVSEPSEEAETLTARFEEMLKEKDNRIQALEGTLKALEKEKRDGDTEAKVATLLKEGKIFPAQKDEVSSLLKTMTDDQIESYCTIANGNKVLPTTGKGHMTEGDEDAEAHESEEEDKKFFT